MPAQNLSAFTPQVWSRRILTKLDQNNVMLKLASRDYEGDIKAQGDTVWVRTFGNVTLTPYRRGQPIVYGPQVPLKESFQINDAQAFAIEVDDLDEAQNDINALDGYAQRAAVALNNEVDAKIMSVWGKAQLVVDDGSIATGTNGGAGHPIIISKANAYEAFVRAKAKIKRANGDMNNLWAVVDADYEAALLLDTNYFIRATDMGDKIVTAGRISMAAGDMPGFVGRCAGFNVFSANTLPQDPSDGSTPCLFGAGQVINYAGQIRKVEHIRRESTFASSVRGLILHDATVFNENAKVFGVIKKTTVTS